MPNLPNKEAVIHNMEQGTEEWHRIRLAKLTASKANTIITPTGKPTTGEKLVDYIYQLKSEMIYGEHPLEVTIPNSAMQWGLDHEQEAREAYEQATGSDVLEVGFITGENQVTGYSPDGLVYNNHEYVKPIEIKCPKPSKLLKWMDKGVAPAEHIPQLAFALAITGFKEIDFIGYCPGLPPFIVTYGDDEYVSKMRIAMAKFTVQYAEISERLNDKIHGKEEAA